MSTENNDVPSVEPGQLITADLMNRLLKRVHDLEGRVATLEEEGSSGPEPGTLQIDDHNPKDVRVGEQVTLVGKNFAVPGELNDIRVGGISVPDENVGLGSTETSLTFTIPSIGGLGDTGSNVNVEVSNSNGSDMQTVHLKPESVVPDGSIELQYTEEPLTETGQIVGGETYKFTFLATAFASQPGDYQATASTTSGWDTRIEEASGDASSLNFSLPSAPADGASQEVTVSVDVPDQESGTTDLSLEVMETTPNTNVNMGKKTLSLEIGSEPPTSEDRVAISLRDSSRLENGVLKVEDQGFVSLNVRCFVGGEWRADASLEDPTGWTLDDRTGTFSPSGDVDSESGARWVTTIGVNAQSGAQKTNLVISVKKDDADPPIDTQFILPVAPA